MGDRLTDKETLGYLPRYREILAGRENPSILEVGIAYGGSLALWREMFPGSVIVGVDVRQPGGPPPPRVVQVTSDQADPGLPGLAAVFAPDGYDLVIDDASHVGRLSVITFGNLWPLVKPGGWYVLEDWTVGLEDNPYYGSCEQNEMLRLAQSLIERIRPAREITDMGGAVVPAGRPQDAVEARYIYGMAMLRKKEA